MLTRHWREFRVIWGQNRDFNHLLIVVTASYRSRSKAPLNVLAEGRRLCKAGEAICISNSVQKMISRGARRRAMMPHHDNSAMGEG
jgi:hypothetical protein